jgi:hypothetical protein
MPVCRFIGGPGSRRYGKTSIDGVSRLVHKCTGNLMNARRGGQKLYGNKLLDAALALTVEDVKCRCCAADILYRELSYRPTDMTTFPMGRQGDGVLRRSVGRVHDRASRRRRSPTRGTYQHDMRRRRCGSAPLPLAQDALLEIFVWVTQVQGTVAKPAEAGSRSLSDCPGGSKVRPLWYLMV